MKTLKERKEELGKYINKALSTIKLVEMIGQQQKIDDLFHELSNKYRIHLNQFHVFDGRNHITFKFGDTCVRLCYKLVKDTKDE